MMHWHTYQDFETASLEAANYIHNIIAQALKDKDQCHIILPGGNSPRQCLSALSAMPVDWLNVFWYLGDERCVPAGHHDRNDVMLQQNLWDRIEPANKILIPAELGPEEAAKEYASMIDGVSFDLAFLGMGEDGHTASLFPGNPALTNQASVVPVYNSPKPPPERVSLGLTTLQSAKNRVVLTGGKAKNDIITRIRNNEKFPITQTGDIHWFIDQDAWS